MLLDTLLSLPDRFKLSMAVEWLGIRDALRHGLRSAPKLGVPLQIITL